MSYGHQWVYAGFKKSFLNLVNVYANIRQTPKQGEFGEDLPEKKTSFERVLEIWQKRMQNNDLPTHTH